MIFRTIFLFLMLLVGALPPNGAVAQPIHPELEWQIAHRYRLFRNEGHFREILKIYQGIAQAERREAPGLALELALMKAAAEQKLPSPLFDNKWEMERFGWASALLNRTCFVTGNRDHYQCKLLAVAADGKVLTTSGEAFMNPQKADILVRLKAGGIPVPGGQCVFSAGAAKVTAPCNGEARLQGIPYDTDFKIEIRQPNGTLVAASNAPQRARHIFIAGLGDSFASGEGNPDRPVYLNGQQIPVTYQNSSILPGTTNKYRYYPIRIGNSEYQTGGQGQPVWTNTQCHRSLYSQQAKAALGIALEQPHMAVSFTGYACTGAEVHEGILNFWKARDDVGASTYDSAPQLMRLLRDYCADATPYRVFKAESAPGFIWSGMKRCQTWRQRPPDMILLSVGGNDIGFAAVIAWQIFGHNNVNAPPSWEIAEKLWIKAAGRLTFEDARKNLAERFPDRLVELRKALDYHLRPKPGEAAHYRLAQTGYPLLTKTKHGVCGASDDGMDVHSAFSLHHQTGQKGVAFVEHLNAKLRDSVEALNNPNWAFTDSHTARFAGHAFCQPGAPTQQEFTDKNYNPTTSGSLDFPLYNVRTGRWAGFQPEDWRAYRPRNRWFVTPNDGFLTGHYLNTTFIPNHAQSDRAQPIMASTLSGAFHPNALGHAATADALIPEIRKAFGLNAPE